MTPKTAGRDHGQMTLEAPLEPAGVLSGSIILTLDGEIPVEHLVPGDRIITRDSGAAVLVAAHRHIMRVRAVRILAGSLGDTRPDRDVVLPEGQQVLVRDWRAKALFGLRQVAAPAHALIDGEFITSEGVATMTLHELRFETPHVIYADGLELVAPAQQPAAHPAERTGTHDAA
ncbi:Hint domain-containing protein [Roseovarius sp. S1116L3]|uniref:Hint domain-containing protein n=1 Tax=Roseovarius roseus TaxID=3342636 RepID=UPI003729B750